MLCLLRSCHLIEVDVFELVDFSCSVESPNVAPFFGPGLTQHCLCRADCRFRSPVYSCSPENLHDCLGRKSGSGRFSDPRDKRIEFLFFSE